MPEKEVRVVYRRVTIDLGTARDKALFSYPGDTILVEYIDGEADIYLDDPHADLIEIDTVKRIVTKPVKFSRFYVTNAAQAGKTARLYIGSEASFEAFPEILGEVGVLDAVGVRINPAREDGNLEKIVKQATTPALYNVTCTLADTEYSQALPANTRKFLIKARGGTLKVCFTAGESGTTFIQLLDGQAYNEDLILAAALTLYFQSPTAGTIAEIVAWT